MKLVVKARVWPDDHYDQLEGNSPFIRAVNRKVSEHWVATGGELPIMTATLSVLGELYDKVHEDES